MDFLTTDMQKIPPHKTRGSALLEALLGIALLGLFLVILMGSVTYLEGSSLHADQHAQALLIADEGLEAVRSMRDADVMLVTDGPHGLTSVNGRWEFIGEHDAIDLFTRSVTLTHEEASTTRAVSVVRWGRGTRTTELHLETYLTNWHAAN